ncbi:MAG: hypothetical protein ONB05_02630, partial [candidate division KSB1 bacterium]|nr:hypothetical protein [candidate division KSB1 bacterium]
MPRKPKASDEHLVDDYRYDQARRKNNPPAGIAPTYEVQERKTQTYSYDPHLDPQLQWAGKAEHTSFEVDLVSLHIHERISTRAILEAVKKPKPQIELFADPQLPLDKQIEFYQHDVNWANRLILGDSLLVMNSLLVREGMAGVAAWFLDTDYDGMTFHICQAFFPGGQDPWGKLQRVLKAHIEPEAFEQMRGTVSFPFQPGEHQRIAVKVIDFRGN